MFYNIKYLYDLCVRHSVISPNLFQLPHRKQSAYRRVLTILDAALAEDSFRLVRTHKHGSQQLNSYVQYASLCPCNAVTRSFLLPFPCPTKKTQQLTGSSPPTGVCWSCWMPHRTSCPLPVSTNLYLPLPPPPPHKHTHTPSVPLTPPPPAPAPCAHTHTGNNLPTGVC